MTCADHDWRRLFRTVPLDARLTSLVFSPEGAALYVGTDDGKLLILDLRALDKPPKEIVVNEGGQRVVCVAVQVRLASLAAVSIKLTCDIEKAQA
jgi:protein NEDD1